MFALCSNISIGKFIEVKPHQVRITKSVHEYVDRAIIKLPITARIERAGDTITASAETAKLFNEGDFVNIMLGYNGELKQEFKGFICRVNFTTPLEIECEGYSYQLRKKTYSPKTFNKTKLLDILKFLVAGTDIIIEDKNVSDVVVERLIIAGQNGARLLEELKGKMRQLISFHFNNNILFAIVFPLESKKTIPIKYRLGWNVIKDNNLKQRLAKNQQVTIRYTGENKDGTKVIVTYGNGGEVKEYSTHDFVDEPTLKKFAAAQFSRLCYDGYEGKITAFLQPYCEPGDTVAIIDKKYKEREGSYLVDSTEVTFGMEGARRIVEIGMKL